MGISWKRLKMRKFYVMLIASLCLLLSLFSLLLLLNAHLPDLSLTEEMGDIQLGKLGEMMISMLPVGLQFTVFIPSERAFQGVLRLNSVDSLLSDKVNETFAILSHVVGFSAVPWRLTSRDVPSWTKEVLLHSVSGFRLYARRAKNGTLMVNNVLAESVDVIRGEITIHVMCGVLMDAEFEQSFLPDDED